MILHTHIVIQFRPHGTMGEVAFVMLICLLHHSCACPSQYCLFLIIFPQLYFVHSIVLDIDAHVISEPEYYGSMGTLYGLI